MAYATAQHKSPDFASPHIRTSQDVEYDLFTRITRALQKCDPDGHGPEAVKAVCDNNQLWMVLASDLVHPENGLPNELKGQLLSLAQFSIKHGHKVLAGQATTEALIDINRNIMKGLRGKRTA